MSHGGEPVPMESRAAGALWGMAEVPGDKSVSHRALILGARASMTSSTTTSSSMPWKRAWSAI